MANVDKQYMEELTKQYIGKLDQEKWMNEVYAKNHISKIDFFDKMDINDPPFFIVNFGKNRKPRNIADFHHHPLHARELKLKADSLSMKNVIWLDLY
jgi:hypothetical protein